jgi:ubiquinone/menaquinone biosynthesis C-methylase UbiE
MDIHIEATGFDARADDYEKGRPDYPPAAVAKLVEVLAIGPGTTVVDLAAGTGKLTRRLLPTGASVIAIEPVVGMRRVLAAVLPGLDIREGTAEHMPLPDGSAEALTVGQAFHWFRGQEALAEIHRVLAPGGGLGLVWNMRDSRQPLQRAMSEVMDRYGPGSSPSAAQGRWMEAFSAGTTFEPVEHAYFDMEQRLTPDEMVARVLSVSYMARLAEAQQQRVATEIAALAAAADAGDGRAVLAYRTEVYWCRRRP